MLCGRVASISRYEWQQRERDGKRKVRVSSSASHREKQKVTAGLAAAVISPRCHSLVVVVIVGRKRMFYTLQ